MSPENRVARALATLVAHGFEHVPAGVVWEVASVDAHTTRVDAIRGAMGTRVAITALDESQDRLESAIGDALEEMDRLIGIFSRFDATSALSLLNAAGQLHLPPPELAALVARSRWFHRASHGAFDVTVAPLVDLFRRAAHDAHQPPADGEVAEALERVGSEHIVLTGHRLRFDRRDLSITLDGIAKGFIVDAMAAKLEAHGATRFLINAGGDIRAGGVKWCGDPWRVAVQDPFDGDDGPFPDVIHLSGAAVATSGGYGRATDVPGRFHHMVNTRTGRAPPQHASVTVVAPTAAAADALATAAFVLDTADALAFIDHLQDCACLIVGADRRVWRSRNWTSAASTTAQASS